MSSNPGRIDNSLIREIKERISLVDIIREHGVDLQREGTGYKGLCVFHKETSPSFHVYPDTADQHYFCFGCGEHGDVFTFKQKLDGGTFPDLLKWGAGRAGISLPATTGAHLNGHQHSVATTFQYVYKSEDGRILARHTRHEDKDGKKVGEMPWFPAGVRTSELPLYRLPELLETPLDEPVVIAEGEKACDALWEHGLAAVSLAGGASQRNFGTALQPLSGRRVYLWPDNDVQGLALMKRIGAELVGVAAEVYWLYPGGASIQPKDDAFDYFAAGGSAEQLRLMMNARVIFSPAAEVPAPQTRERLSGLVCLEDVEPEPVHWLWPGRIPLGKLTILDGDPGLGKSMITCDLAARVSTGRAMPDGTFGDLDGPAGVVLLSAEDGLADTIRPRLDAAGADCSRIAALTYVVDDKGLMKAPSVADISAIERAIAATGAKLIIIDPVMAYLPEKTKSHNDQEVRYVLAPLVELAERTGVAILMLRHLNKAPGGNPIYRGGGSIAFIGAVRSGLLVAPDPEDEMGQRRILVSTKSNLARPAQALAYHVITAENGAARIVWEGTTSHTAAGLLTAVDQEEKSALDDAVAFLRDLLGDGEYAASEVEKKAKNNSIAIRTLHRAKSRLGVMSHRRGAITDAHWVWALPSKQEP